MSGSTKLLEHCTSAKRYMQSSSKLCERLHFTICKWIILEDKSPGSRVIKHSVTGEIFELSFQEVIVCAKHNLFWFSFASSIILIARTFKRQTELM